MRVAHDPFLAGEGYSFGIRATNVFRVEQRAVARSAADRISFLMAL
jgi:hypothetical protein